MTESEYKFFEDQESLRQAKCVKVKENSTPTELRFQRWYRSEALLDQPSTSNISENISLSSGSDSELSVSESSCEFYETSNKKQKLDATQNREQYFYLAQCCDRYNISDRAAGAALATSVLIDHGIIKPNDTKFVVGRRKLPREWMRHREEKRKKRTVS